MHEGSEMTIQVTGKNIDAGDAFKTYTTERVSSILEKYIGPEISGHVRLEKERAGYRTSCSIRLRTGLLVEAHGDGSDAYASADVAIERLEKRVRRYKRRLKSHHNGRDAQKKDAETRAADYTVRVDEEAVDEGNTQSPVIIAETERGIRELPVKDAVMQLDLTEQPFLVFRNAAHGGLNVVYRRADGHIGWIDPAPMAGAPVNGTGVPSES